jgi:hypothetical protein
MKYYKFLIILFPKNSVFSLNMSLLSYRLKHLQLLQDKVAVAPDDLRMI